MIVEIVDKQDEAIQGKNRVEFRFNILSKIEGDYSNINVDGPGTFQFGNQDNQGADSSNVNLKKNHGNNCSTIRKGLGVFGIKLNKGKGIKKIIAVSKNQSQRLYDSGLVVEKMIFKNIGLKVASSGEGSKSGSELDVLNGEAHNV